jgi:hypothetical protein
VPHGPAGPSPTKLSQAYLPPGVSLSQRDPCNRSSQAGSSKPAYSCIAPMMCWTIAVLCTTRLHTP